MTSKAFGLAQLGNAYADGALQEALADIATLKTEIAALKGASA